MSRRAELTQLASLLVVALVVRLWGFHWGLPGPVGEMTPIQRAWGFWNWGRDGGITLNPHDFGWPSFIFYLAFIQQALFFAWGRITGSFASPADFRVLYELDPSPLIVLGRAFSTAADLGTVALTWFLAKLLYGRHAALAAGAIVALDLHHVAWSQNTGPEVWVALFTLLASVSLLRISTGGTRRDYLLFGLWCGLGAATKYTPALLLASLPLAHFARPARRKGDLLAALGATVAAFFVASPYVILDPRESLFFVFSQSRRLGAVPHFGQESLGPGWIFYLVRSLPESIGWIWLVLAAAGMIVALRSPARRDGLVFVFPVLYFIVFGAASSKYAHYMLPVTPFLAIAGAGFLQRMVMRTITDARRRAIVAWGITAIGLVMPAVGLAKRHPFLAQPDTRNIARAWIEANLPRNALIVTEFGGPDLLSAERLEFIRKDPSMREIAGALLPRLEARPSYAMVSLPLFAQEPAESAPFYNLGLYDRFAYCITSTEVSARYRSDPRRFKLQVDFYDALEAIAHPLKVFRPMGGPGPTIEIYPLAHVAGALARAEHISPEALTRRAYDGIRQYAILRAERAAEFTARLGRAYERGGELQHAALAWTVASEFSPRDVELRHGLGEVFARLGRYDLARSEYERVLSMDPDHVGALNNLGGLELNSGHPDRARRLFERALSLRPDFADAHANLGWVLLIEDGDGAAARQHFLEALRLAPAHPGAVRLRSAVAEIERQGVAAPRREP